MSICTDSGLYDLHRPYKWYPFLMGGGVSLDRDNNEIEMNLIMFYYFYDL